jgi:hypothetical protein
MLQHWLGQQTDHREGSVRELLIDIAAAGVLDAALRLRPLERESIRP